MGSSRLLTSIASGLALTGAVLAPPAASALIIDFSLAGPGSIGSPTYVNGPVRVDAFYRDESGNYVNTGDISLFAKNTVGNHGFGVCSPSEACTPDGSAELGNFVHDELIRLTLEPGWTWVNASVSALTDVDRLDRGQLLYAKIDALPGNLSFATLLTSFSAASGTELDIPVTGEAASAQFLYFVPQPIDAHSDYLVWKVEVEQRTQVPEPATTLLLGVALAAVSLLARKYSRRK